MKQLNQKGTIPYLIQYYYDKMGMRKNVKLFLKEISKIHSSMIANDLTMEQVKNIIDGMIRKKVKVLLFFDTYVSEFSNQKQNEDPIHNYTKEREISENVNEIMNGKMTIDDVSDEIRTDCLSILKDKYMKGDFDKSYNYFEWAFKIHLPLDKEMYQYGVEHNKERKNRFDSWLEQINNSGSEKMKNSYEKTINNYNDWLSAYA